MDIIACIHGVPVSGLYHLPALSKLLLPLGDGDNRQVQTLHFAACTFEVPLKLCDPFFLLP